MRPAINAFVKAPMLISALVCAWTLSASTKPEAPDVTVFDCILKSYVLEDGTVKYAELKANLAPLTRFVEQIGAVSPDSHPSLFPSREHKLAYWLNTYNALVLWIMAKEYPEKKGRLSTEDSRTKFFKKLKFEVGRRSLTLDEIERNYIRQQFREPRIHFAIVCASASCPWLSRDALRPESLEEQLESRTRFFLNQERNIVVDSARREVRLSAIFDWFREDFGSSAESVVAFIARYRPDLGIAWQQGKWKLRYFDYDWRINEARSECHAGQGPTSSLTSTLRISLTGTNEQRRA